jgi:hypothetical protein
MDAPVENAGQKINCLKCRQRLQIPPAERAKTILADAMGVHDDGEPIPIAQIAPGLPTPAPSQAKPPPLPNEQIAPKLPTPVLSPAKPPPLPNEPAQPARAVTRSPIQAVGMFFKWMFGDWRVRLAGIVGGGLVALTLVCTCGGLGVWYIWESTRTTRVTNDAKATLRNMGMPMEDLMLTHVEGNKFQGIGTSQGFRCTVEVIHDGRTVNVTARRN